VGALLPHGDITGDVVASPAMRFGPRDEQGEVQSRSVPPQYGASSGGPASGEVPPQRRRAGRHGRGRRRGTIRSARAAPGRDDCACSARGPGVQGGRTTEPRWCGLPTSGQLTRSSSHTRHDVALDGRPGFAAQRRITRAGTMADATRPYVAPDSPQVVVLTFRDGRLRCSVADTLRLDVCPLGKRRRGRPSARTEAGDRPAGRLLKRRKPRRIEASRVPPRDSTAPDPATEGRSP
jgi:hypothetical protein